MDMKKILQAMDGVAAKPAAGANDMKKFLSIVTEGKDTKTNRLTTAEQIAFQEQEQPKAIVKTNPVLNKPLKNETLIKSYVEQVLAEQASELESRKEEIRARAARVVQSMREGVKVTKVDPGAKTISYTDDATGVTTTVPQTMAKPEGGKIAVDKTLTSPGGADQQDAEIKPGMDVDIKEVGRDAYQRDYDSSIAGMGGGRRREVDDEANLMYRFNQETGKLNQRMVDVRDERSAKAEGWRYEWKHALRDANIIQSKFDPKKFVQKQGGKWVPVNIFRDKPQEPEIKKTDEGDEPPMEGLRDPKDNPCWKGYKPVGTKQKGGRTVPNCVPK